jgi:hypothetical protein
MTMSSPMLVFLVFWFCFFF